MRVGGRSCGPTSSRPLIVLARRARGSEEPARQEKEAGYNTVALNVIIRVIHGASQVVSRPVMYHEQMFGNPIGLRFRIDGQDPAP